MTLKELRKSRGMTLAQIAEQLGVPVNTYHRWESGKIKPSGERLVHIKNTLKVDVKISFQTGEISYREPEPDTRKQPVYPDEVWALHYDLQLRCTASTLKKSNIHPDTPGH